MNTLAIVIAVIDILVSIALIVMVIFQEGNSQGWVQSAVVLIPFRQEQGPHHGRHAQTPDLGFCYCLCSPDGGSLPDDWTRGISHTRAGPDLPIETEKRACSPLFSSWDPGETP